MEGTITISKNEYIDLKLAEERLKRLELGGVDNWHGYEEAINPDYQPDMEDFEDSLGQEISER